MKYVLKFIHFKWVCLTWCRILLIENGNGLADCNNAFCNDAAATICEFTEDFISASPTSASMTIGFWKSWTTIWRVFHNCYEVSEEQSSNLASKVKTNSWILPLAQWIRPLAFNKMDRKLDRCSVLSPAAACIARAACKTGWWAMRQHRRQWRAARPHKCAAFASKTSLYKIIAFCCGAL